MHEPRFEYASNKQEFPFNILCHSIRFSNTQSLGWDKPNCDIRVSVMIGVSIGMKIKIIFHLNYYFVTQRSILLLSIRTTNTHRAWALGCPSGLRRLSDSARYSGGYTGVSGRGTTPRPGFDILFSKIYLIGHGRGQICKFTKSCRDWKYASWLEQVTEITCSVRPVYRRICSACFSCLSVKSPLRLESKKNHQIDLENS